MQARRQRGRPRAAAGRAATSCLAPDDPHGVALQHISLRGRGGEIVGIAGVAGNGQDELFAAMSGERAGAGSRRRRHRRAMPRGRRRSRAAQARRGLRAGGAARPRAPRRACSCRRTRCCPATPPAAWSGTASSTRAAALAGGRPRHRRPSTCARASAIRKPRSAVRRQSAEIRRRPRNPARTRRAGRRASRPGASTPARPPMIRQALIDLAARGRGGPGHQPGPRRALRNRRPHRRDVPRPPVGAAWRRGCEPREARPADGRQQRWTSRKRRMQLVLETARRARRALIALALAADRRRA